MFNNIPFVDILLFTKHLSVMIKSGIPISEALTILRDQTINSKLKSILRKISDEVANGTSLSKAMEKFPQVFNKLYLSLVTVGEDSGNLEVNLEYLSVQLQKDYEFKKKVQSAMLYPGFVVVTAIVLGGGIAIFVLPQMTNLFASLDIKLPMSTQILIAISNFMKNWGIIAIPGFLGFLAFLGWLTKLPPIKPGWHSLLMGLPVLGQFLRNVESASFCRSLGLMIKSGFPINKGIEIVRDGTENQVFRKYLTGVLGAVESGKSIESELGDKKYKYIPLVVSKMIGVGEKTGKLDETLLYLGDFFAEEVDNMTKNLPTILEPILLTAIAGMVAFIAMAIISPIYEFTSSVHR